MVNIRKTQGDELLKEFAEMVYTVAMESRATVSKQTGALRESTVIRRVTNGFSVTVPVGVLRSKSRKGQYYATKYMLQGYGHIPAFNYIEEATELADSDRLTSLNVSTIGARNPSHRRGAGVGTSTGIGKEALQSWVAANKGKVQILK